MDRVHSYKAWDAAEMAHELASPLSAMTLHLESLASELKCCEHCQKYVPIAVSPTLNQVQAANTFLQDYLGTETKALSSANIQVLVTSVCQLISPIASRLDVSIVYARTKSIWWPISPYFFRQVLLNILNNTLETYQRAPNLSERKILISTKIVQQKLIVEVKDFAGGIELNGNPQGHGIGLHNLERYVHRLNGQLEIQSRKNVGTTVKCTFNPYA